LWSVVLLPGKQGTRQADGVEE